MEETAVSNPLTFQVRSEVQRAADHHPGGGRDRQDGAEEGHPGAGWMCQAPWLAKYIAFETGC